MRYALCIAAAALLAGCGTTTRINKDTSPAIEATLSDGSRAYITGEIVRKTEYDAWGSSKWWLSLHVLANGKPLLSGPLDPYTFNGAVSGRYGERPAVANCIGVPRNPSWTDVSCDVAIDGTKIGTLKF